MTIDAGISYDRVDILHGLEFFLVVVTSITKVISRREELIFNVGGMDIMAGLTIVNRRRVLDLVGRLGIVTFGTESGATLGQQTLLCRSVRSMTAQTIAILDRRVNRTLPFAFAVMTLLAKGRTCFQRQLRSLAGMRVMTTQAITIGHRRMNHLGILADKPVMALIAKRFPGGDQQFGVIAGMRGVAGGTSFVSNNRMDTFHPFGRVVVTAGTEISAAGDEKLLVFTLMGIMTTGTAVVEGGMNNLLSLAHAVVALFTKSGAVGSELESTLAAGVRDAARLVTGRTITTGDRVVLLYPFGCPQRCVTTGGHTTVRSGSG